MAHSAEYLEELKKLHDKKTFGLNRNIPAVVHKLIKEKKIKTSITIDPLLHNTLKKISKKNGRTVSNYIEMLVRNHLEDLQKGKQKEIK